MKIHSILAGLLLLFSSGLAFAADPPDGQTTHVLDDPRAILPNLYAAIQTPQDQDSLNQNPNSPTAPNNHPSLQQAQEANQ